LREAGVADFFRSFVLGLQLFISRTFMKKPIFAMRAAWLIGLAAGIYSCSPEMEMGVDFTPPPRRKVL
jgi:hypothetical protein